MAARSTPAKICRDCKILKPLRLFYRQETCTDGHRHQCKECTCAYQREAYLAKREVLLETRKRYRASARGRATIIAYRRSARGLAKQAEANRFRRAMRRMNRAAHAEATAP